MLVVCFLYELAAFIGGTHVAIVVGLSACWSDYLHVVSLKLHFKLEFSANAVT